MKAIIIIGKGFGDEGKGLAADFFAARAVKLGKSCVCVRHNGGAQAGHTVDMPDRRFVFSQLSSASYRRIPTFWADSFLPDLFKLPQERERFFDQNGFIPDIYASGDCRCTYIGDVLINMLLETVRGSDRHGSCGMGINEAVLRSRSFPLYLKDIAGISARELYLRLSEIKREYTPARLKAVGINPGKLGDCGEYGEYGEMLESDDVLKNAAEAMCRSVQSVSLRDNSFLEDFEEIIFEGAQGLLLDENRTQFAPHLTSSRTGVYEPARILNAINEADNQKPEIEIVYVTRSYVTRHGAGQLPYEGLFDPAGYGIADRTNIPNEWQGSLRFAAHGTPEEFLAPVEDDLHDLYNTGYPEIKRKVLLFITHLNETGGCMITSGGSVPAKDYCRCDVFTDVFDKFYLSYSPFSGQTKSFPAV